jgi:hypothetical protein
VAAQQTWHDNGGVNVLYSAAPMENAKQNLIPVESSSVSAATIDFGGSKVRFGSVHPFSPRPRNQGLWNRSLDSLAQLQHYDNLYVLMGDFNSTWDHASFRYLLGSRFLDSGQQAGEGLHMTYPAMMPIAENRPYRARQGRERGRSGNQVHRRLRPPRSPRHARSRLTRT